MFGTKNKKKIKSSKLPIQSSLPRVTRAATRLQFGSFTKSYIDFTTLPISHSSECANVSCPSVLTALPQESEVPQPSSNVHSSIVVPNVDSSRVAPNCMLFDLCCGSQECKIVLMLVLPLPCMYKVMLSMTLLTRLMRIHIMFMTPS